MNTKTNSNLLNFFIFTIAVFYSFGFHSSADLTTNLKFRKVVTRAARQIRTGERNSSNCTNTEFTCVSRDCIKKSDLCNGIKDCKDGSDETTLACRNFKCPNDSFFRCDYGACVRATSKCNGRIDCADKSDETNRKCKTKQSSSSVVLRRCRLNDQWRCKTSNECILKSSKCNGRNDCTDGSDEDIQDCKSKPSAVTTIKPNFTPIERPTNDTCNIPYHPDLNSIVLTDREDNRLNISLTDLKAPKLSKIEIFCNPKYALVNGEKVQKSICQQKGQWHPVLRPCQKSCPNFREDDIDITCYRNGLRVDCNSEMVRGTGIRPVCKPFYHSETEIHGELTCLETGNWDRDLPKCVPDCGIPNIPSQETLVYQGMPTNASDSPWHVAIYKLFRTQNILICGGTLISANMVLSAAHCFFDEGRNMFLNSSSDYEIVVSKYTRTYQKIDNSYQRAHKIRDIIFTEQGYNPISTNQHSNDIVVLVLEIPVEISKYVLPACVDWSADNFEPAEGIPGKLVGWGENQIRNKGNEELLYAELPFISYKQCIGKVKHLDPDKFCAGSETGAGARKGDSGGGLMFRDDSSTKVKYYVRGVVSTRDAKSRNSYATFTDISKHIEWLEKVRVKVTTKTSENQRTFVGVCDVQYGPDKRIELFDKNNKWMSILSGSRAPEFSSIEITCNPTYLLPNMDTFQRSVCFQEGKWTPSLEPCLKECEHLGSLENIDLTCHREDSEINCINTTLIAGTVVRPRCKNLYQIQGEAKYRELKCQENGKWDNKLFKCVPTCGVPQTELVWPSIIKTDWMPSNASDSPWNVAIYKREKNGTFLQCCGTLISASLVISGWQCFVNTTTQKYFHQTEDYEIVVSKYTSDYNIIDNDFQKKYRIRQFIQPHSDTHIVGGANYNIILLELETPVEFNKFVLPACVDWELVRTGFQPPEGTPGKLVSWALNTSPSELEPSVLRHTELLFTKSCHHSKLAYDDLCTKTANGNVTTWSWYHGAGLVFRDSNTEHYFLRGITADPKTQTYTDISNEIAWIKSVYDRVEGEQVKVRSTSSESSSNGICEVPISPHSKVVITDYDDNKLMTAGPPDGWRAQKFSKIQVICNPKYALDSGEKFQRSVCMKEGTWDPPLGQKCVPECGIPNNASRKTLVYQGAPTNASDFPWHVAIYKLFTVLERNLWVLICGGTLISANMVLSAAHCFFDEGRNVFLNSSSDYEVVVGKYTRDYQTIDNSYQRAHEIRDIIFTEQGYNPILTDQHSNDIVVLVLKSPVEISSYVLPACVDWSAGNFQPAEGTSGKLVGWGENQFQGVASQKLLYAELPFISYQQCIGKVKQLDPDKFCAGSEKGAGARKGDSGGGLVFRDASTKGKYYVRGIVSTRDARSRNSYATFTDISKHIEWLEKVRTSR